jgi:hypothetical protein
MSITGWLIWNRTWREARSSSGEAIVAVPAGAAIR